MDKLLISSEFPVLAQPHLSLAVQLAIEVALTAAGIGHVLKIG